MDEDLLLGGSPAREDDLFNDALMAVEEDDTAARTAAAAAAAAAADGDAGASSSFLLPDGTPATSLSKKEAKATLDKAGYKAWKKAMKALGGGGDSDDEADGEKKEKKDKKKDKKDKKKDKKKSKGGDDSDSDDDDGKKKKKSSKKDKKKRDRDADDEEAAFAAELEGLAGDADALDKAKRRRREKVLARMATLDADGNPTSSDDYAAATAGSSSYADGGASRRGRAGASAANAASAKRLTKEQRFAVAEASSRELVQRMAAARKHDTAFLLKQKKGGAAASSSSALSSPPIQRILLRDTVLDFGRRVDNEVPLINAGFLAELAHWIVDGATNELAPLDLRNVAYELLLKYGFKGSMEATHPNRIVDTEDLNAWEGIGREHLEGTTLGRAVNVSRQHSGETAQNRKRAVTLLQRLSRAYSGGDDSDDEGAGRSSGKKGGANSGGMAVRWACDKDATIATPFEYITNATEVFVGKVAQVDPLDPESYLRVPPLRIRKTPIR